MATEDQILLKLVIQGQDPAEIQRLAASTQGQLNDRIKVYLDHLTELHKQAAEAVTAEQVTETKKRIDAAEKQVDTVSKVMRANEIAANRSSNAWKGTLEVMENIATSATFMYGVLSSGAGRLKDLGDSIDKVTNVYGSLKGSIDEMREASLGEVSDFDLIATKNRALEKDLELTDKQFGLVARAADNFADSIGVNTKEALDKLIDGLAQGRLKSLAQAGVVIDSTKAFADYAKSIGVAADQLSDHGKKMAIIQAALDKLAQKNKEAGTSIEDFSHDWEAMTASINNATDSLKLFLGQLTLDVWHSLKDIPSELALEFARIKDALTFGANYYEKKFMDTLGHENDSKDALTKIANQKFRRYGDEIDPNSFLHPGGVYGGAGDRDASINAAKVAEDAKKAEAARKKQDEINAMFDNFLRKLGGLDKATLGGKDEDLDGLATRIQSAGEKAVGASFDPGASRNALTGRNNEFARQQTLQAAQARMQENIARSMEAPDESNDLSRGTASKESMDRMEKALKAAQDRVDDLRKRGGDGVLADLIFGIDGPGGLQKKLDTFQQMFASTVGMVSDAGQKMAEALGASLAAAVSGDKLKSGLRQQTHDILEALSAQAYSKAIMETAEGLAMTGLALFGNPAAAASATAHFAAAGMYATVGTVAGLGARAVGNPGAATAGSGASGGATATNGVTSGSGFGSGGVRATGASANDNSQPVVINLNVMPGGEAEAGRQINKALSAYYSQTGQGVAAAMVTA